MADPGVGLRLVASFWRFWLLRFHNVEGRRWAAEFLARAPQPTRIRAQALTGAGYMAWDEGDDADARLHWEESLTIYRAAGDERSVGDTLTRLGGNLASGEGDYERARTLLEESLVMARAAEDRSGEANALVFLGEVLYYTGDLKQARAFVAEALASFGELQATAGWDLDTFGRIALDEGSLREARSYLEQGLEIALSAKDAACRGWVLGSLASLARVEDDYSAARACLRESVESLRTIGHRPRLSRSLALAALLAMETGDAERAARLVGSATSIHGHFEALLGPNERADLDALRVSARSALGEEAFARAWAEGHDMSIEQAVEYSLAE